MANLLLNPAQWIYDNDGSQPPSCWNGSTYADSFADNVQKDVYFTNANGPLAGNTYAGILTFNCLTAPSSVFLHIGSSSDTSSTFGFIEIPTNVATSFSFDASLGDVIKVSPSSDSGVVQSYYGLNFSILPTVPPIPKCDELGRTTRTYVSGYSLSRQNVARVRRRAKRCVVANFNGAIPKERIITAVRWETTSPWSLFMSNARIASGQRETMVDVIFNFAGWGGLLATVTLDNGEEYNAEFSFTVLDSPLYPSADYPSANGPYRLDATA